jgi:hypothetical protein
VDYTVLENIPKHEIQHHMGDVRSWFEIKKAIQRMANTKAPGKSGLTTDMLKNLPPKGFQLYVDLIQDYWKNQDIDYDTWHITTLSNIYKGKGDLQDPNNHQGICLKETSYKVVSIIIANRLLQRLKQLGANTQFGHIGCQEAQHIIKRALLLRRQHGLESFVLFVDLVKAFDTIQHTLLVQILEKYGIPPA